MNEWVSVKECIYWGYGQMDLGGSILLLLRPWMSYDFTIIQVVYWIELPEQKKLSPNFFFKIWILINGTQQCGNGSLEIYKNSAG